MIDLVPPGAADWVVVVDEHDRGLATMPKLDAHIAPGTLHRAFSVVLFDLDGRVLLQRRAWSKHHFRGLWSNTCCSHPRPGETLDGAARRRLDEELGLHHTGVLQHRGSFVYRSQDLASGLVEHELDHVLVGLCSGTPAPDRCEVAALAWHAPDDLARRIVERPGDYTPWLGAVLALARGRTVAGVAP